MKGIILAGGTGSRLLPLTLTTSKQLLPVFDKPMVYYPLSVLMMAKIQEILIISTPHDLPKFETLFKDGSELGLSISYAVQEQPKGIAEAFLIAQPFIGQDPVCLILGDNIFYGDLLSQQLNSCCSHQQGALIFGYEVKDPSRYGVIEFDSDNRPVNIIEKPKCPPSSYAVTGLYFYDALVCEYAKRLKPSARGELEISDLNQLYLEEGALSVKLFDRGFAWLDTGTHDALHKASSYVQTIQERQGIQIACIEEIAYQNGWIDLDQLEKFAKRFIASDYGEYLTNLVKKNRKQNLSLESVATNSAAF